MAQRLVTDRLILRTWHIDDAHPALDVFGHVEVARWLSDLWSLATVPQFGTHTPWTPCALSIARETKAWFSAARAADGHRARRRAAQLASRQTAADR